jgi:hypothetical protein
LVAVKNNIEMAKKIKKNSKAKKTVKRKVTRSKAAIKQDKTIKAKHAGKRTSEDGNVYYENRDNRSDENRTKKFEGGGGMGVSDEDYFKIVNHFVYFCFNYPENFLDAWGANGVGTPREHMGQKFDAAYEKAGVTGAMIKFWTDLDSTNRRIFADWIKNNYDGGYKYEYEGSVGAVINHFVFFTLNYPQNFIEAFGLSMKEHMRGKFDSAYQRYGAYGAMVKFWSDLDTENKEIFARWIKENYKGSKLNEYGKGGGMNNNSGSHPNPASVDGNSPAPVIDSITPPVSVTPPIEVAPVVVAMIHDKELTCMEVEEKIGRKLSKWNVSDDKVVIEGVTYKKCFMRPSYRPLK